jgi:hypothetical protein
LQVQYNCSGVLVTTADGQVYKATEVISTLPLGAPKFSPKVLPNFHRPGPLYTYLIPGVGLQ